MKPEHFKEFISIAAVFGAVASMFVYVIESQGFGDSSRTAIWFALAASAYAAIFSVYYSRMREHFGFANVESSLSTAAKIGRQLRRLWNICEAADTTRGSMLMKSRQDKNGHSQS